MNRAYFQNIEQPITANLKNAQSSIKVAVAWFTNPSIYTCILDKLKSGITVEIILADDRLNFLNPSFSFQDFIDQGGVIYISSFPKLMHHKFCIIDDRLLITGSYNWTKIAETRNYENVIVSTELPLINQFTKEFERLENECTLVKQVKSIKLKEYASEIDRQEEYQLVLSDKLTQKKQNGIAEIDEQPYRLTNNDKDLLDKARILYNDREFEKALAICNKICLKTPNIPAVYDLMASIKWRQEKYYDQIKYAQKAIDLDNKFLEAYNTLALGHIEIGNSQKAIEFSDICINANPVDYVSLSNRARAYLALERDPKVPQTLKPQFHKKAQADLDKVIQITTKLIKDNSSYTLFFMRGFAWLRSEWLKEAKLDLDKAVILFKKAPKIEQDTNELLDIKFLLKEINRKLK